MTRSFVAFAATVFCTAPVFAQTVAVRDLPGGATLIVSHDPTEKNVVIEALFRVGVADENAAGESGLAALLTRTWAGGGVSRSAGQIARDIERFGTLGVYQTGDYVELWTISGYAESGIAAQTLLANVVAAPTFPAATLAVARAEIGRERAVRGDGLLTDVLHRLRSRVFALSPAGRDPLGDPQNGMHLNSPALRKFYDRTVGADASRAVFVVAGNMDADEAERLIRSCLAAGDWAAWRDTGKPAKPIAPASDAIPAGLRPLDTRRAAPSRLALVGYVVPGTTDGAKTAATLHVLDAVMGMGKDSRLFALRDKTDAPIGYDITSRLDTGREQSLWIAYVSGVSGTAQSAQDKIIAVCRAVSDGSSPVTDAELLRAKALLIGKHRRDRQRLTDRASALGVAQVMGLGATFESEYEARINAVTVDAVQALARRVFGAHPATAATGSE